MTLKQATEALKNLKSEGFPIVMPEDLKAFDVVIETMDKLLAVPDKGLVPEKRETEILTKEGFNTEYEEGWNKAIETMILMQIKNGVTVELEQLHTLIKNANYLGVFNLKNEKALWNLTVAAIPKVMEEIIHKLLDKRRGGE